MEERPIQETATEARQAVKVGPMRYVLGLGIAGRARWAFAGLALLWRIIASTHEKPAASGVQGSGLDWVLSRPGLLGGNGRN